jgi:uncharacterized protein YcaQ
MIVPELSVSSVRRLALARGGLLPSGWTGLVDRAGRGGASARRACHEVIARFGYLQLDTISVTGARSHAIVLHSRLQGLDASLVETLLQPEGVLFEYWGHEASWIPLDLYPAFAWRRERFKRHPWYGDVLGRHRDIAAEILRRVREEGPLRSVEVDDERREGMWNYGPARQVLSALWSAGDLAVRERVHFHRSYDLAERVIPEPLRAAPLDIDDAYRALLLRALEGHGWATETTLAHTFRTRGRPRVKAALERLREEGIASRCRMVDDGGKRTEGWVRTVDLDAAEALRRARPDRSRGVLLSPFDPLLWDRARARTLFGFDQVLEIYVPPAKRRFGYYCLPVLAGEDLIARVDLKAHRRAGRLEVVRRHMEPTVEAGRHASTAHEAVRHAVARFAASVGLDVD